MRRGASGLVVFAAMVLVGCNGGDDDGGRRIPSATVPKPTSTASATRTLTATVVPTFTATSSPSRAPTDTPPLPTVTPTATATEIPTSLPIGPWQRTEERAPCADFALLRQPFFGDLHVHTSYSADAYIFGTRAGPDDAYAFARGATIAVSDEEEQQTRAVTIERPLDFAAVTDHAEFFGEVKLCTTPDSGVYDIELCQLLRQAEDPGDRFLVTVNWLYPAGIDNPPPSHLFCAELDVDCDAAAVSAWSEIQAAAEGAYDRSPACSFTTFIGYENTNSPFGRHLHRNVIFRNHNVPRFPASHLETVAGGFPQGLWTAIENDCLNAGTGCDALIIPHNPNLSGGGQWPDPLDAADAKRRHDLEPLVEMFQIKAGSECRFDRLARIGTDTEDELCTFEQRPRADESPGSEPLPPDQYPRRNMVRNTLKDGLALEESLGVNPFQLGFFGSTDNHNATAGNTDEANWEGGGGNGDASPERRISGDLRDNPGGLAVVWAEENSRDALFAGLRRRETYATSGTRPLLRFFAGALADVECESGDFLERAYRSGSPMGGVIGPARDSASPRFAVLAAKDPGIAEVPGTDLQRAQIVKGWVDAEGQTHEKVFDVAGDADNGATVDTATCAPLGAGAPELCAVWEDPEFDRAQRAFYYVRLLENPTCRWSTITCKQNGVDPFSPDCAAQATAAGEAFANCCRTEDDDPFYSRLIQERAWSSAIWYQPEAIAGVAGALRFGTAPGADAFDLSIHIGRLPPDLDPQAAALVVRMDDDDRVHEASAPAGALRSEGNGRFVSEGGEGFDSALLEVGSDGAAQLRIQGANLDLAGADRTDHVVSVSLSLGPYASSHARLWKLQGSELTVSD